MSEQQTACDEHRRASEASEKPQALSRRGAIRAGLGTVLAGLVGTQSVAGQSTESDSSTEFPLPAEKTVLYDDWEDESYDDWDELEVGGDGSSRIESIEAPEGGSSVLSLHQSQGSGTEYILGTEDAFTGWGGEWTIRTNIHTTDLDPSEDFQKYEIIPGYDSDNGDDPELALRVGVRDGDGELRPAQFIGPGVTNSQTYDIEWEEDQWYNVELSHDGGGGFSATVWRPSSTQPSTPNVEASGPVPTTDEGVLALHINGPGYPEFRVSHAFIELRGYLGRA